MREYDELKVWPRVLEFHRKGMGICTYHFENLTSLFRQKFHISENGPAHCCQWNLWTETRDLFYFLVPTSLLVWPPLGLLERLYQMTPLHFNISELMSKPLCKSQLLTPGMRSPQEGHRGAGVQQRAWPARSVTTAEAGRSHRAGMITEFTGVLEASLSISI